MFIECLIQREGPTEVVINGFRYKFEEDNGKKVSFVQSPEHQKWFLRMESHYRRLNPEKVREPIDIDIDDSVGSEEEATDEEVSEADCGFECGPSPPKLRYFDGAKPSEAAKAFESEAEAKVFFSGLHINELRRMAKADYGMTIPFNSTKVELVDTLSRAAT